MEGLLFYLNPVFAALISIGLNIFIAIAGVLPSTFITIGTIGYFGLKTGLIILIIGEALGAIVSFILYRKGIHKLSANPKSKMKKFKLLQRLKNTGGVTAIFFVVLLRILPFVPSGAVTLTAAFSKINLVSFSFASTIGKIPALLIEAYSTVYVLNLKTEWQFSLIIFVIILYLLYLLWKRKKILYTNKK
ncbi:TVP38/TMEM64 family protein [Bacillus sp. 03113]|uniref:TVP38/TMEM64 family protein n=1 Tax=Bacillus sp. 03113 TaxID=2578211 RepID=UPI001143C0AE|nr:VTT domain-containing protein [Bacillus sp. 03113]